jgi:hypothetical protein
MTRDKKAARAELKILIVFLVLFLGGDYACWRAAHPHDHPLAYGWDCGRGGNRR